MYLHVVGFGPKHIYGMASWDDDDYDDGVNCYVSIRKFPELVYVLNTLPAFVKHARSLNSLTRWERRGVDDELVKGTIVCIINSLVIEKCCKQLQSAWSAYSV